MALSRYCNIYIHPEDNRRTTLFSTSTMEMTDVSSELDQDIKRGNLTAKNRKNLASKGFLVKSIADEKREMLGFMNKLNALNDTFRAVVVLNLDCNFACKYCFEGTRKGKFYMSADTADRFVDFVKSVDLKGKKEIEVVFYGGEPLLSMDIIIQISKKLRLFARSKRKKYSFFFISNGSLLTTDRVRKLKPIGLTGASITLDGPREVHDAFRPFKTGKGSFDAIVNNIKKVCKSIDILIGGNYTQSNYREFPRFLDYLLDAGLDPKKISLVRFDPVFNESKAFGPPDFHGGCKSFDEPWLFDAGIFLREEILKRGFRTQELAYQFCLIEHDHDVVVNYDGTLYKCPCLVGRKEYCVGSIETGLSGSCRSHYRDNWKNEKCLACSYLPLCFGGCRYMKLLEKGTMKGISCRKNYFDKTLAHFVRQDMQYGL